MQTRAMIANVDQNPNAALELLGCEWSPENWFMAHLKY
jgi:hypothetical protein